MARGAGLKKGNTTRKIASMMAHPDTQQTTDGTDATTMRAMVMEKPRQMRLTCVPKPEPKPHEALVRIESVGVCGSDVHYYRDGAIGLQQVTAPLVLGHEYAGVVEAAGTAAGPALVGRRVAVEPGIPCGRCEACRTGAYNVCTKMFFPGGPGCDGALCEYMAVDAAFCFPIPEDMPADVAAMIEPVAVALHAVELAHLRPGETAAILGLGPIGLLTAQIAKMSGVRTLYGADLLPYRAEAAATHGVDHAFLAGVPEDAPRDGRCHDRAVRAILQATDGRGVDVAFDCTNGSEGLKNTVHLARGAGRCVLVGISGAEEDILPVSVARRRELTLRWCRRFKHNYPAAIELVHMGKVKVRPLVTHSFPLERAREAYELVSANADGVLKASIDF